MALLLREFLSERLASLGECLDIAKERAFLHCSLNVSATTSTLFLQLFNAGRSHLCTAAAAAATASNATAAAITVAAAATSGPSAKREKKERLNNEEEEKAASSVETDSGAFATAAAEAALTVGASAAAPAGLRKRCGRLRGYLVACILDDVNLSNVFSSLRIEELLECCYQQPSITLQAAIILAILGELLMIESILSTLGTRLKPMVRFVRGLLNKLTAFIIDKGRDRYTYIKESLACTTCTPPRPLIGADTLDTGDLVAAAQSPVALAAQFSEDFSSCQTLKQQQQQSSIAALYNRGDAAFEELLTGGTILSLSSRLVCLYRKYGAFRAKLLIFFSVQRKAPFSNRLRQLTFTRLLQALAVPLKWESAASRWQPATFHSTILPIKNDLLHILASALLSTRIQAWCYESEEEKDDICIRGLRPILARNMRKLLCIKVCRSELTAPENWELPEADTLSREFLEERGSFSLHGCRYRELLFSQNCCARQNQLPSGKRDGDTNTYLYSLAASRLHSMTPEFFSSGSPDEVRCFTSPLLISLMHPEGFENTLENFFVVKDIELEADFHVAL